MVRQKRGISLAAYAAAVSLVSAAFGIWQFGIGLAGGDGARVHIGWAILITPIALAFGFFTRLMLASRRKLIEAERSAENDHKQ